MICALTALFCAAALAACAALIVRYLRRPAAPGAGPERRAAAAGPLLLAGLGGLFVFFVLESAISRRVGLDLFLPVRDGQLLPGRAVRLAAALPLCFALGLTGRGRALRAALDRLCQKDAGRWAVSAVVTGLLFAWVLRVSVLSFLISDDQVAMRLIASIPEEGLEAGTRTFPHVLFCGLLSLLYRIAPDGYWYTVYHVGMQLLVSCILGWCILGRTARRGWPALAGCLIHALFSAGVLLYTFGAVTFTLTAAVTGTGAVALVLCRNDRQTAWGRLLSDGASALMMLLCWLNRPASGKALFCFWGLAMGFQLVKTLQARPDRWVRRAAALLAAAAVTGALAAGVPALSPVQTDPAYHSAEVHRSRIEDYLIDHLTDEHFQAAGIPKELASMLRYWYFMDERVTTANFRLLEQAYSASRREAAAGQTLSAPERWLALSRELGAQVSAEPLLAQLSGLVLTLLILCAAAFVLAGRRYWPEFLTALCAVGGVWLMGMYLIRRSYFPVRAFQVVLFPAAVTLLLTALARPAPRQDTGRSRRRAALVLAAVSGAAAIVLCCRGAALIPRATVPDTRADAFSVQWDVEAYARAFPDVTIINNAYDLVFDPLHSADYPENLIWWGACGDTAKAPEDRLYADAFFRDDVQFLTKNAPSLMFLLQYLSVDYGPVQALTLTRMEGGVNVYDISRAGPEEPDYTGWYQCNGMTYYFRDGRALTGRQTIDGREYEFAPAGADSRFFSRFTDDGSLIYSTDACSLITDDTAP